MTPGKPHEPFKRRTSAEDVALPERRSTLWLLIGGPAVWAVHFLASYATVAIWCAKAGRAVTLDGVRTALVAYTVAALVAIAWLGWHGLRQHRWGAASLPHDDASAGDRHRFLGFATLLLCGLSFVAVIYMAMAIAMIGTCR